MLAQLRTTTPIATRYQHFGSPEQLKAALNKTSDQEPIPDPTQYMKKYYSPQNCETKLRRLIEHYSSKQEDSRYLNTQVQKFILKNKKRSNESCEGNPEQSAESANFNFYARNVLTQSLLRSREGSLGDLLLGELAQQLGLGGGAGRGGAAGTPLNYVSYRNRNKMSQKAGLQFQKQLNFLYRQWLRPQKAAAKPKAK